jgi:predicted GNAT superfamily acetyltransferase
MSHQDAAAPVGISASESITLADGSVVRNLTEVPELEAACRLYREVFSYSGEDQGINARLLKNLLTYGGTVVGAVDPSGVVRGMAFGWTAVDTSAEDPHIYHFSQAAVVSQDLQGQGVGRALKNVQAAVAARLGASRMRWTYNPMISRNAHFNLDVLGAQGRWFARDALAGPGTDRVTVEWRFDREAEAAQGPQLDEELSEPGQLHLAEDSAMLAVPATQPTDSKVVEVLRARFGQLFDQGFVATSCRRISEDLAVYSFTRSA